MFRIYVDALYLSRRQTAGVAKATLRIVDDERTVQTREDGVLNKSVVPKLSETTDKLTSPGAPTQGRVAEGLSVVSWVLWKVIQEHKKNFEDGSCYKIQKVTIAGSAVQTPRHPRASLYVEGMYL